jgi:hypothetical protein
LTIQEAKKNLDDIVGENWAREAIAKAELEKAIKEAMPPGTKVKVNDHITKSGRVIRGAVYSVDFVHGTQVTLKGRMDNRWLSEYDELTVL